MSPVLYLVLNREIIGICGQAVWKKKESALHPPEKKKKSTAAPSKPAKEPDPQLVYTIDDNVDDVDGAEDERRGRISGDWTERRRKDLSLSAQ